MGAYTEVEIISCPSKAAVGQTVSVTVRVTNKHSAGITIWTPVVATGKVTNNYNRFIDKEGYVSAGQTKEYIGTFIMFNEDVDVSAYAYYWTTYGYYHLDDEAHKTVELSELVPEFSGLEITDYRR